ncbi:TBC1 domain family member 15 [Homo sapiens]|uniref:TBC1 domain family member 15 n=1 Tax=Homo sapiens TaxID=9606 RepID=F8WAX5_HUMAN|nr:TBC1 domain family member 15 [Homo sapiens]KAI4067308.1 TBC1 domain family member 15 [Homo sapiens]
MAAAGVVSGKATLSARYSRILTDDSLGDRWCYFLKSLICSSLSFSQDYI